MRLVESRKASETELAAIRSARDFRMDGVPAHVRRYILKRFLLEEEESAGLDLNALVALSIAKSVRIAPELVNELDKARDCAGSTSAMAKKALLFRNVEKQLCIELSPQAAAEAQTTEALAAVIWDALLSRRAQCAKDGDLHGSV